MLENKENDLDRYKCTTQRHHEQPESVFFFIIYNTWNIYDKIYMKKIKEIKDDQNLKDSIEENLDSGVIGNVVNNKIRRLINNLCSFKSRTCKNKRKNEIF